MKFLETCRTALAIAALCGGAPLAWASETDQYTLPRGREFADLGPHFTRFFYDHLRSATVRTNARIEVLEREGRMSEAAALRTPQAIADAFAAEFPWAADMIGAVERDISSPQLEAQFPGKIVGFHPEVTIREYFLPIHPANLITDWFGTAITFRIGHTLLGTDKIGHFTDMGKKYYDAYQSSRRAGASEEEAEKKAVSLGTDNLFLSESGLLGLMTANAYSNGDLAANYVGYLFYRNLTEAVRLGDQVRPPMLELRENRWRIAPQVRADSDFFEPFITDHLNEALNPSVYGFDVRGGLRKAVADRSSLVIEAYADAAAHRRLTRQEFARTEANLQTFFGANYGHWGGPAEIAFISTDCFPKLAPLAPNARDALGRTPLHLAAQLGEGNAIRDLLRAGAKINAPVRSNEIQSSDWGMTPLHYAAAQSLPYSAMILVEANADVTARDDRGATPLHYARRAKEAVELVRRGGSPIDVTDALGRTPLHWAAANPAALEFVSWMLAHGAAPTTGDKLGQTALHNAARADNAPAAAELVRFGGDPGAPDRMGVTPLHLAAGSAAPRLVDEMLQRTSQVDQADEFGRSPLHDAARVGQPEAVRLLLAAGANAKRVDLYGVTPLHLACRGGHAQNVQLLLEAGANARAATAAGATPLHEAAILGDLDVIELLLAAGGRPDVRDRAGRLPADVAARHGHASAAARLRPDAANTSNK